jgi:hypothetical protein
MTGIEFRVAGVRRVLKNAESVFREDPETKEVLHW